MKNPAVLWYPGDFIASTSLWNNEQCGAYIRLLNYQFVLGHLSLEQIDMVTKDDIVLNKFIKDKKGLFFNQRMQQEIDKRSQYIESRSKNKLGKTKEKNKNHMKIISKSYENHMGNGNGNINIDNNIYYTNIELDTIFKEFLLLRKKLKAVNSERAIKMLIDKLSKYDDDTKIKMLNKSIVSSWKDVYELKEDKTPTWFDKETNKEEMTKEELAELEESLKEFR